MRTIDLTPLYRSIVGVDRMIDLMETATRADAGGYPPFNVEEVEQDAYRIEIAVAGFGEDDLRIEVDSDTLVIAGERRDSGEERTYLHRGIAQRSFERRFKLAEHVHVTNATLDNGLLVIELIREVPEAKKPRRIAIGAGTSVSPKVIDANS